MFLFIVITLMEQCEMNTEQDTVGLVLFTYFGIFFPSSGSNDRKIVSPFGNIIILKWMSVLVVKKTKVGIGFCVVTILSVETRKFSVLWNIVTLMKEIPDMPKEIYWFSLMRPTMSSVIDSDGKNKQRTVVTLIL